MSQYLVVITVFEDDTPLPTMRMALESIGHIPAMIQTQIMTVQGMREQAESIAAKERIERKEGEEGQST